MPTMGKDDLVAEILDLKKQKNATILAHNYQHPEVQDIADYLGDSLGLSRQAAKTSSEVIVFCGVDFMAETAAILCPEKTVLLPKKDAGCPMSNMVDLEGLNKLKRMHPNAATVAYVNSSALIKANVEFCCTSANAVQICKAINNDEIIMVPDKYLGSYVEAQTGKKIYTSNGFCPTHMKILASDIRKLKSEYPDAEVLVHPECTQDVIEISDYVVSTGGMSKRARESPAQTFIIGTETGMNYRLKQDNPKKNFIPASDAAICPNMKKTRLEDILESLKTMREKITIPKNIRVDAKKSIDKMLEISV